MVRDLTGCICVGVHHFGWDGEHSVGSSALPSAADFEHSLVRKDDQFTVTLSKIRDGKDGDKLGFTLKQIELGEDDAGRMMTSCIVVESTIVEHKTETGRRLDPAEIIALDSLQQALGKYGQPSPGGDVPGGHGVVTSEQWRQCHEANVERPADTKADTFSRFLRRKREALQAYGNVGKRGDWVWLIKH